MLPGLDVLMRKRQQEALLRKELTERGLKISSNASKMRAIKNVWKTASNTKSETLQTYNSISSTSKSLKKLVDDVEQKTTMIQQVRDQEARKDKKGENANVGDMRRWETELATLPTEAELQQQATERRKLCEEIEMLEQQNERTTKFLVENDIETLRYEIAEQLKSIQRPENDQQTNADEQENKTEQAKKTRLRRKSAKEKKALLDSYFGRVRYDGSKGEVSSTKMDDQDSNSERYVGRIADSSDSS